MPRFQSPTPVSQKVSVNEPLPGSPTGPPMERVARLQSTLRYQHHNELQPVVGYGLL